MDSLFRRTRTIGDVTEHIRKSRPVSINVIPKKEDIIRDWTPITRLVLIIELIYRNRTVYARKICGGFLNTDSETEKLVEIRKADKKLKEFTAGLREVFPEVKAAQMTFRNCAVLTQREKMAGESSRSQLIFPAPVFRDQLEINRTVLANERTMLSYLRTALLFSLAGMGIIRFSNNLAAFYIGGILVVIGVFILIAGVYRFFSMASDILSSGSGNPEEHERNNGKLEN